MGALLQAQQPFFILFILFTTISGSLHYTEKWTRSIGLSFVEGPTRFSIFDTIF
jgi:hypothetical protein